LLLALLLPAACAGRQEPVRTVFFTPDGTSLDADAQAVVRAAAAVATSRAASPVSVLGYSIPRGMPATEERLAAGRATTVADALVAAGVPRARIAMESRPATPFESAPVESRRVEIRVGAASR
jgi:outer membrane protein OmpA-like peptidoglycan-associated protein